MANNDLICTYNYHHNKTRWVCKEIKNYTFIHTTLCELAQNSEYKGSVSILYNDSYLPLHIVKYNIFFYIHMNMSIYEVRICENMQHSLYIHLNIYIDNRVKTQGICPTRYQLSKYCLFRNPTNRIHWKRNKALTQSWSWLLRCDDRKNPFDDEHERRKAELLPWWARTKSKIEPAYTS